MPDIKMGDLTAAALNTIDETDISDEFNSMDIQFGYTLLKNQNKLDDLLSTIDNFQNETKSIEDQNNFLIQSLKGTKEDILKILN